ncbi:MAG TPA: lasso RiPP family leader peptide-containing protein [Terriglobia bacterium]|nr:lasso RiPP family leader peptide-containing protein [Terriglobia bacterium]
MKHEETHSERKRAGAKKPYETPKLLEYGDLSKLTQGVLTVGADVSTAAPHSKNSQCL